MHLWILRRQRMLSTCTLTFTLFTCSLEHLHWNTSNRNPQASALPDVLKQPDAIKSITHVLATNVSVCTSLGPPYLHQMQQVRWLGCTEGLGVCSDPVHFEKRGESCNECLRAPAWGRPTSASCSRCADQPFSAP